MLLPLALILTSLSFSFGLECGSPGQSFHHETDSRSYYICDDNNLPMQFMCPDGQVYDRNQRKCDLAENVEFDLNTDSSADHEATDLQDDAELETPQRFVLDIKDLKTVMEKLGKPKIDNLEEELKDKEKVDQHDTENLKEVEKREINEDEEDANEKGDATNESQIKEEMKNEDDKAKKSSQTESLEISKYESIEGVSKDEGENREEQSEKEIGDTVMTSGVASPTAQKELFPSVPMYTGFVPLNEKEKSKSSSAIYGYQDDFEEDDKGVAADGVNKEDEQLELTEKGENNEDALDKSGEKADNIEEDKGILEGKDSKTNEGDEEKSIEDENTDGDKQVNIKEEETKEGDQVYESFVQKSDDEVNNAKNNSDEQKADNDEGEDKDDESKAEQAEIGDEQDTEEDEEKVEDDEQKTDDAEQAGNSDEQKTDKDEQEDKVDEPKPDEDKDETSAKE